MRRTPLHGAHARGKEQKPHPMAPATPTILGNERGLALVMALVLGLVGMLMITAILYMVGTGTWIGGSKKRYQTALSASHGAMTFFAREVIQRGLGGTSLTALEAAYPGMLSRNASDVNFAKKLSETGTLGVSGYPGDNPDATLTFTFTAPTPNMTINTAIVGTSRGNSGTSSNVLVGGGVVNNSSGTVTPQHIPYLYQTEVQTQSGIFARERARLSGIYVY